MAIPPYTFPACGAPLTGRGALPLFVGRIAVLAAFSDGAVSFWPDVLDADPRPGASPLRSAGRSHQQPQRGHRACSLP